MEEIYPPKIKEFANVTDAACTEEEIFQMEITILRVSVKVCELSFNHPRLGAADMFAWSYFFSHKKDKNLEIQNAGAIFWRRNAIILTFSPEF